MMFNSIKKTSRVQCQHFFKRMTAINKNFIYYFQRYSVVSYLLFTKNKQN